MAKLTEVQAETMEYCKKQIDDARKNCKANPPKQLFEAQNGIVYTQGGRCTSRTLRALEKKGLLEILEDNSGIGMGGIGAFPSKVKILNY